MTQQQAILEYLKQQPLTSMQAIVMFGATRLSAHIYNLRKAGYNIITENKTVTNRYGNTTNIAVYRLVND